MQETNFMRGIGMSFEGFIVCVKYDIQKMMGSNYEVSVEDIRKNNDMKLKGLIIKEYGINIAPTIYLNSFYNDYIEGRPLDYVEQDIIQCYRECKFKESFDMGDFTEWERARQHIVFKVVNYERNEELLRDVPHLRFLDLAVVFNCLLATDKKGSATILIHNKHMKYWKTAKEELYIAASENTPKLLPFKFRQLSQIVGNMVDTEESINMQDVARSMYILTNEPAINGAGCILYHDVLKDFSEKMGKDLYILPSSVHETLIIPEKEGMSLGWCSQMVRDVNASDVRPDEILSDRAYKYVRETREIIM